VLTVVGGVALDVDLPFLRDLVLGGDGIHGARLDAGVTVDALLWVDVELLGLLVAGLARKGMYAVDR